MSEIKDTTQLTVGRITFTPAPWEIVPHGRPTGDMQMHRFVGANGQGFAYTVGLGGEQERANVNLIGAAPDMLAALHDAVAALGGWHSDNVPESVRSAITKAEGTR